MVSSIPDLISPLVKARINLVSRRESLLSDFKRNRIDEIGLAELSNNLSCMGHIIEGRHFIDECFANHREYLPINAELALQKFLVGDYVCAEQLLTPDVLHNLPATHLANLVKLYADICLGEHDASNANVLDVLALVYSDDDEIAQSVIDWLWSDFSSRLPLLTEAIACHGLPIHALLLARMSAVCYPDTAETCAAIGIAQYHFGFFDAADREFCEALFKGYENSVFVWNYRFLILCITERWTEAETVFPSCDASTSPLILLFYADLLLRQHDVLAADHIFSELSGMQLNSYDQNFMNSLKLKRDIQLKGVESCSAVEYLKTKVLGGLTHEAAPYHYVALELIGDAAFANPDDVREKLLRTYPQYPGSDRLRTQHTAQESIVFEFNEIFIPRIVDGSVWPTDVHKRLLEISFLEPKNAYIAFTKFKSDYNLRMLDSGSNRLLPQVFIKIRPFLKSETDSLLLKSIWRKSFVENASKVRQLLSVGQCLCAAGVSFTVLKGLANTLFLYGDASLRPMSDIDILIPEALFVLSDKVLKDCGWQPNEVMYPDRLRFQYALTYRNKEGQVLDVHWRLSEDFISSVYDQNDFSDYGSVKVNGQEFQILSPTLMLLHTILHGVRWNHQPPVRWISDAILLTREHRESIDWNRIYALAKKYDCLDTVEMGVGYLIREGYQAPVVQFPDAADRFEYLLRTPKHRVRLRDNSVKADQDEVMAILKTIQRRWNLQPIDRIVVAGGADPNYVRELVSAKGIAWIPYYDEHIIEKSVDLKQRVNVIVLDANHNCLFRIYSVY